MSTSDEDRIREEIIRGILTPEAMAKIGAALQFSWLDEVESNLYDSRATYMAAMKSPEVEGHSVVLTLAGSRIADIVENGQPPDWAARALGSKPFLRMWMPTAKASEPGKEPTHFRTVSAKSAPWKASPGKHLLEAVSDKAAEVIMNVLEET